MKLPLSLSYCHCLFYFLQFSLLAHNYGWLVARRTPWTSCVRQAVCTVCLCNLLRNQRRSTRRTRRRRLSFLRWSASSTAGTLQAEVSPVIIETATEDTNFLHWGSPEGPWFRSCQWFSCTPPLGFPMVLRIPPTCPNRCTLAWLATLGCSKFPLGVSVWCELLWWVWCVPASSPHMYWDRIQQPPPPLLPLPPPDNSYWGKNKLESKCPNNPGISVVRGWGTSPQKGPEGVK